MSLTTSEMTPADIAAVSRNGGAFGGDGAWWIIILFLFLFAGGGMLGGNSGAANNYVLASDFATLQRQIDSSTDRLAQQSNGIANGLCDGFYTQAQLNYNTNMAVANGFAQSELSRANNQTALMTQLYAMQSNADHCCCENKRAIADLKYSLTEQNNANTRAVLDAINAQAMAAKDAKIADQAQRISNLELAQSQLAQNNYLISALRPSPVPAFSVAAPYQYGNCGSGCGCSGI